MLTSIDIEFETQSSLRLFVRLPREIDFCIRGSHAVVCETIEFLQRESIEIDVVDRTDLITPSAMDLPASEILTLIP